MQPPNQNNSCGERYISQYRPGKRTNKLIGFAWRFQIVRDYVTHCKYFKTFEEAVAYKTKYLNN